MPYASKEDNADWSRERFKRMVAAGICTRCRRPVDGKRSKTLCTEHVEKKRQRSKRERAARRRPRA